MADDPKAAWDKLSGVSPGQASVSYLMEMVRSNATLYGGLGSVVAGMALSFPLGAGFILIPPLLFLGLGGVAALFVPSSPVFQESVNRRVRAEAREKTREHLKERIGRMGWEPRNRKRDAPAEGHQNTYERMMGRLESLRGVAADSKTALTTADLEKLDETTVDFLRLWYARLLIAERMSTPTTDIERRIRDLTGQVEAATTAVDRKQLTNVKADLERIVAGRARLPAKEAAVCARLVAMGEAFEELYHRINTDPTSNVSDFLSDANSRLSVEEELSLSVEDELADLSRRRAAAAAQGQRA